MTMVQASQLPSLVKEGWTRHQEIDAKPPLRSGRGGSFKVPIIGGLNVPPRLRPVRRLRAIFFTGRSHPSFTKEGSSLAPRNTLRD
jgi:hypothetical protein